MKIKEYKRIKGSKLESLLKDVISQHEKFNGAYFWTSPGNASSRRAYEKKYSRDPFSFIYNGKTYDVRQDVSCSCKNVYYHFSVQVDNKKKDIRALKALVK